MEFSANLFMRLLLLESGVISYIKGYLDKLEPQQVYAFLTETQEILDELFHDRKLALLDRVPIGSIWVPRGQGPDMILDSWGIVLQKEHNTVLLGSLSLPGAVSPFKEEYQGSTSTLILQAEDTYVADTSVRCDRLKELGTRENTPPTAKSNYKIYPVCFQEKPPPKGLLTKAAY